MALDRWLKKPLKAAKLYDCFLIHHTECVGCQFYKESLCELFRGIPA